MLIAAHIAKGHPGNPAAGNTLKIQRASATGEDLNRITACSDQQDRAVGEKYFVLIGAGSNKDLIEFAGFLQCRTRPWEKPRVLPIDDERLAAEWIWRRIVLRRFCL